MKKQLKLNIFTRVAALVVLCLAALAVTTYLSISDMASTRLSLRTDQLSSVTDAAYNIIAGYALRQVANTPISDKALQDAYKNLAAKPVKEYRVSHILLKTEADAQASWQQLQSKYSSVLGNQQVSFKRVDLGDRGTFYRAMVGPFSGRDQAYEMCQNLKAAGGECVVQRN